jgi:glutamate synthase domain-containing protein 2
LVLTFATSLLDQAIKQIGLDEMRRHFGLKPQKLNLTGLVEEKSIGEKSEIDPKTMNYFQKKVQNYSKNWLSVTKFWSKDVQNAADFLDRKFPEVRRLFKVKYEELRVNAEEFNKKSAKNALFAFMQIRAGILTAFEKANQESIDGLLHELPNSACYVKH